MTDKRKPEAMTAEKIEEIRKRAEILERGPSENAYSAEKLAGEDVPAILSALEDAQTLAREWRELVLGAAQDLGLTVGPEATGPELLDAIGDRVRAAEKGRDEARRREEQASKRAQKMVERAQEWRNVWIQTAERLGIQTGPETSGPELTEAIVERVRKCDGMAREHNILVRENREQAARVAELERDLADSQALTTEHYAKAESAYARGLEHGAGDAAARVAELELYARNTDATAQRNATAHAADYAALEDLRAEHEDTTRALEAAQVRVAELEGALRRGLIITSQVPTWDSADTENGARLKATLEAFGSDMRALLPPAAPPEQAPAPFDMLAHLAHQREWSERTFGPGHRPAGLLDHIRKELQEIERAPNDLTEWIDVVILALDGAWRSGHSPAEIVEALVAKQAKNEGRKWPDWRTAAPGQAIEHVREDAGAATAPVTVYCSPRVEERAARADDDLVENGLDGKPFYVHGTECEGACDYGCSGHFVEPGPADAAPAADPICARDLSPTIGGVCGHLLSEHPSGGACVGSHGGPRFPGTDPDPSDCTCPGFVPPEPEGLPRPLPNGEPNYPALAEYHRRNSVCTDGGISPDGAAEVSALGPLACGPFEISVEAGGHSGTDLVSPTVKTPHVHRCMRCHQEFECRNPEPGACAGRYDVLPIIATPDGVVEHCPRPSDAPGMGDGGKPWLCPTCGRWVPGSSTCCGGSNTEGGETP